MEIIELHSAQVSILRSLRYAHSERFSALMKPTGQESDTFKFHLRRLVKLGYVKKRDDGRYELSVAGKEFANGLEESQRRIRKQPTLAVFLVVPRMGPKEQEFLLFKRARNPLIGYWTCITDPVRRGESLEERAAKRLKLQTGLEAEFTPYSMRRFRNYTEGKHQLLEDLCFIVMIARNVQGELNDEYGGGEHAWLTLTQLKRQDKYYQSAADILENLNAGNVVTSQDLFYSAEDF